MKRAALIFDIVVIILIFTSCATSKGAQNYPKMISGKWELKTIVSEGITGKLETQIFNEADFDCFIGSIWNLNRNTTGNYNIMQNASECNAVNRNISWSVYEAQDRPSLFQFKRLDDKLKEIDENSGGFRFTIIQLDNKIMHLKSDFNFEGKPAAFIYNFVKI